MSPSERDGGGLSIKTLAIASAASALATLLVPMIWRPGTIAAAAATPVIVALISEALSRPAEHVSQAGRLVRVQRPGLGRGVGALQRHRFKLAIVTGLLAFALVAVALTTTELAAGESVTGDQRTTLLGGQPEPDRHEEEQLPAATPEPTTPAPASEATPEGTATPEAGAPAPGQEAAPQATPTPPPLGPQSTPSPAPTPAPGAPAAP